MEKLQKSKRERIYEIIDNYEEGDKLSYFYDILIFCLLYYSDLYRRDILPALSLSLRSEGFSLKAGDPAVSTSYPRVPHGSFISCSCR